MHAIDPANVLGPTPADAAAEVALLDALRRFQDGVVVAFSGGVDSSYVLWAATRAVGTANVRAVTGVSAATPASDLEGARAFAATLGVAHDVVATRETEDPRYLANEGDRYFYCKDELYAFVEALPFRSGKPILDGTNADDVFGHRPGHAAAKARGVKSPLLEHGVGKEAVRRLSRRAGLSTADRPSSPCLASRFPAGVPVTIEGLARIEAAEAVVRGFGLREFRVRHHGDVARLEIAAEDVATFLVASTRAEIDARLRALGYRFVALDLAPFRSGRGSSPAAEANAFGV
jgi:pyridinium-3,5-biscarboxylic acid mononucleotide sulfurtransferase